MTWSWKSWRTPEPLQKHALELGGQSSGRGGHDMGGGDRDLTADGLERGTAASAADV